MGDLTGGITVLGPKIEAFSVVEALCNREFIVCMTTSVATFPSSWRMIDAFAVDGCVRTVFTVCCPRENPLEEGICRHSFAA